MEVDKELLGEMCSEANLLEYAQNYIELSQKSGNIWFGHCMAHHDPTPSLAIYADTNSWYCFGCHRGGNILNFMIVQQKIPFNSAVEMLSKITGIQIKNLKKSSSFDFFKKIKRIKTKKTKKVMTRNLLDITELDKYSHEYPQEWLDEGITPEAMDRYNIRIDPSSNRICYPIWTADGENIITMKGRTRYKNFKDMNIPKYISFQKMGTMDTFVGLKENYPNIIDRNEVVIFEGIKSVMKAFSWGFGHSISAETSVLNNEQVKLLLKIRAKNIVIAFDSDVPYKKIVNNVHILRKFANVYIIYDRDRLLGKPEDKMSPVDKGQEIWEQLYNDKKKI